MPFGISLSWSGITPEQYDDVRVQVGWETDPAPGGLFHMAWFDGESMRVIDAWESPEQYEAFVGSRLMPVVTAAGITTEPVIEVFPLHRAFSVGSYIQS